MFVLEIDKVSIETLVFLQLAISVHANYMFQWKEDTDLKKKTNKTKHTFDVE